jgi:Cu2+-exporting ATPase
MLCDGLDIAPQTGLTEVPGQGILAYDGARLGSASFVGADVIVDHPALWYRATDGHLHCFAFTEEPRPNLPTFLRALKDQKLPLTLLSGDSSASVAAFAGTHGITTWHAGASPHDKLSLLQDELESGTKPLMFGDGINDAPALKAAYASVSFASATQVAQAAADIVLTKPDPELLTRALATARDAQHLIKQNLWFSAVYNLVTVPLALAGVLNPLLAAVLMSSSSIAVLANGLRLRSPQ